MVDPDQRRKAIKILVTVGLLVALVFGIFAWKKLTRPNIGQDNCVYEDSRLLRKAISNQTAIVVDQSETLSASNKRQVKEMLIEYLTDDVQLPVRSEVLLYVFGKNDFQATGVGQELKPSIQLCRPPASGNEVVENKRKIERNFHGRFVIPLYQAIDASLEQSLGERSPILEMLQYISRTQDIKEGVDRQHKKTLILVSDMLQHSSYFSHYKQPNSYEHFLKSASILKVDLRGWTVQILYLQRYGKDKELQKQSHLEFWMRYFHEAGAKIARIDQVP